MAEQCPGPPFPCGPPATEAVSPVPCRPLLLSCLLALPAGAALADECDQLPPPAVTLQRLDTSLSINRDYGYKTLTILRTEQGPPGQAVLGLTRGTAIVKFQIRIPTFVSADGRMECASPQINVIYGFRPMTVYIAREFPPGSCAYQEIFEHELRHVRTYQEHLSNTERELVATLSKRFTSRGPWRGPVGETRARLQDELDSRWLPYISREISRVKTIQAEIDTPEEYARVTDSCGGEIKRKIH